MNPVAVSHSPRLLSAAIIGFAVLWVLLIHHLSIHWSLNPQYGYGWFVPLLALYLFARRWTDRPPPSETRGTLAPVAFFLALLAFPVTWVTAPPNPDWRLVSWAFALETVVMTLAALHRAGGSAWSRHFAFPVCFLLIAIPWPTAIENFVIQNLMALVAAITVEGLNVFGIAAVQQGNLIEVSTGLLGVDDACSGVRSLQATLMASLFLGELFRFRLALRIVLVACGVALAMICNIARAFFLAWSAATGGPDAVARWHDPAGYTILLACFAGLCVIAGLIRRANGPTVLSSSAAPPAKALPKVYGFGLAAVLVVTLVATEGWYRLHEARAFHPLGQKWPENATDLPISEEAEQLLQYDKGTSVFWQMPDGTRWRAFAFQWNPGARRSTILARMHRPDICLPASGMALREDRATISVRLENGLELPFRSFTFASEEGPLHVYFCVWHGTPATVEEIHRNETESYPRLRAVARGKRHAGQQVLEFVLSGYESAAAAENALRKNLPQWIHDPQTVP